VILVAEADKFTLGQELTVQVPHSVLTLMKHKGNYWLTNSWLLRYQSMLCENPRIQLESNILLDVKTISWTTLLLFDSVPLEHNCLEVMNDVFSSKSDLNDKSISSLDVEYFTDGSSFLQDGKHFAGYAIVTLEAHLLPVGTSAQKLSSLLSCRPPAHCTSSGKHLYRL
jgi:hypothetical protein